MPIRSFLLALPLTFAAAAACAQQAPNLAPATYTAISHTAMGVTGDVRVAPAKLILHGHAFPLTLQQTYTGDDLRHAAKLLSTDAGPESKAALYRVHIPGNLKLANGNTFCGANTPTTFVLLLQNGSDLEMAGFSGSTVPDLDPAVIGNSTSLCGTYGYTRR